MSGTMFILFEAASGYSLFEITGLDELQAQADAVQQAVSDMNRFGRVVKLIAFVPFKSAADALEQVNAVSEATMTDELKNFLELNLPKVRTADLLQNMCSSAPSPCGSLICNCTTGSLSLSVCLMLYLLQQVKKDKEDKKKKKFQLGVAESKMGNSIQEETGIPCVCNDFTGEVLRGIRMHATRFMKDLEESDMNKVSTARLAKELFLSTSSCSSRLLCSTSFPV